MNIRSLTLPLLLCYFISGCAALIYELLWVRLLTLVFGHTALSAAIVIAAFMGGLGIGSFIAERRLRWIQATGSLTVYSVLEFVIAVSALISQPLIQRVAGVVSMFSSLPFSLQHAFWFFLAFGVLLVPTMCMGATLPLLTQWMSGSVEHSQGRSSLALLYGINTLGSVVGVIAAGFWLIPAYGVSQSLFVGAGLNAVSGLMAFVVRGADGSSESASWNRTAAVHVPFDNVFGAVLCLSGAALMICEVGWTRAFALVLGSSTYSFTVMLLTFLLGFSLGSLSFNVIRRYFPISRLGLAAISAMVSLSVLIYLPFFNKLPYVYVRFFPLVAGNAFVLHLFQLTMCATVMALPTFCAGLIFPWIVHLDREKYGDSRVGAYYLANTVGAIVGSAVAGLALLPRFGSESTLLVASGVGLSAALLAFSRSSYFRRAQRAAGVVLAVGLFTALVLVRPRWNPAVISSGPFLYAPDYLGLPTYEDFVKNVESNRLLFQKDGLSSTVSVFDTTWGYRFLRVNGKTDASTGPDMITQTLLGYLPRLFIPNAPTQGLVIGLGSGVTAATLASDPGIKKIDCVEIEPLVAEALPFFSDVNHYVKQDPRFHLIFADARQYLSATKVSYDLIISEPSNPWIAGVSNLYTREGFAAAKRRLTDQGIFCQWFHSYSMSEPDFKMVLNTFLDVFPHAMLFTTGDKDYFLIGSNGPWDIDYNRMSRVLNENPVMKTDLTVAGLAHPFTLLVTTFLLDGDDMKRYAAGAPIHSDRRPTLEFSAPRYLHRGEDRLISAGLLKGKTKNLPVELKGLHANDREWALLHNLAGEAFLRLRQLPQAYDSFLKAQTLEKADSRTWVNLGRVYNLQDRDLQAEQAFRKAVQINDKFALGWFHLGMLYLGQGMNNEGLRAMERGLSCSPGDPMGSLQVAGIYLRQKRDQEARQLLLAALRRPIYNRELHAALVQMLGSISAGEKWKKF